MASEVQLQVENSSVNARGGPEAALQTMPEFKVERGTEGGHSREVVLQAPTMGSLSHHLSRKLSRRMILD